MKARWIAVLLVAVAYLALAPSPFSRPPTNVRYGEQPQNSATFGATGLRDIVDTVRTAGELSIFSAALAATDVDTTLRSHGPYTIFAPTDDAFHKLPPGQLEDLQRDPDSFKSLVMGHIVRGDYSRSDLKKSTGTMTLLGSELAVRWNTQGITVGDANLGRRTIQASNGTVYPIDTVLTVRMQ